MDKLQTSFILGYHGCFKKNAEKILHENKFEPSQRDYDWLGHGIYFWESSPARAWQWAREKVKRQKEDEPAVLGAVIDLGLCLDTMTLEGCLEISTVAPLYDKMLSITEQKRPENEPQRRHFLDCAIINLLHDRRRENKDPEIDTVRGIFYEGEPLYKGAMFYEKTHSQVCVRNPSRIKGIFKVIPDEEA